MQHTIGSLLSGLRICKQYKKLVYKKCIFCISSYSLPDAYLLTKGNKVIRIDNIIINSENETFLLGKQFQSYNSFYNYPINSKLLNIYVLNRLSLNLEVWSIDSIMAKVIILPLENKCVCFPIIHSNS